jgi:low temperature requirement protein LtrA
VFFDLVFVFALTQVTALMAHDVTLLGLLHGMLITAIVWWCWVCFSWLANAVKADVGAARVAVFVAMAGMFVIALSIPEAFHDLDGGLDGPTTFAAGYLLVRLVHVVLFTMASRDDPGLRRQVTLFAGTMTGSTVLLLVAARFEGAAETVLWAAVLVVDYGGTLLIGNSGWRLRSGKHFAERHGLIIIVALGESIVAIGVGVAQEPISWPIIVASALGLSISGSLWWAYFDVVAVRAEHRLSQAHGRHRVAVAQMGYSYVHLPMLAGIVLVALGMKKVLEYVADLEHHTLADALSPVAAAALLGGAALFLLAHVVFGLVTGCGVDVARPLVAALLAGAVGDRAAPAGTGGARVVGRRAGRPQHLGDGAGPRTPAADPHSRRSVTSSVNDCLRSAGEHRGSRVDYRSAACPCAASRRSAYWFGSLPRLASPMRNFDRRPVGGEPWWRGTVPASVPLTPEYQDRRKETHAGTSDIDFPRRSHEPRVPDQMRRAGGEARRAPHDVAQRPPAPSRSRGRDERTGHAGGLRHTRLSHRVDHPDLARSDGDCDQLPGASAAHQDRHDPRRAVRPPGVARRGRGLPGRG